MAFMGRCRVRADLVKDFSDTFRCGRVRTGEEPLGRCQHADRRLSGQVAETVSAEADTMNAHDDTITTELSLRLVVAGAPSLPVLAAVRFDPSDPYAVHVGFRTGGDEVVEWTFARQLLTDGVSRAVGEGDVQVWPSHAEGTAVVCLSLCSPSGRALFEVPLAELVEFLSATYVAVPTGTESDFVDLDAELALLLWAGDTDAG